MNNDLLFRREPFRRQPRVAIPQEQRCLKENDAPIPDGRRPAEYRQQQTCEQRLNQKDQPDTEEYTRGTGDKDSLTHK